MVSKLQPVDIPLLPRNSPPSPPRRLCHLAFVITVICILVWVHSYGRETKQKPYTAEFRWSEITPSRSLRYHPCYSSFRCARLSVPLNWNDTSIDDGGRAAVAIVKLPAKVEVTDSRYGGILILNPGGPGESGISQVLSDGKRIQMIVDPAEGKDGKYFDILSFDPRGVNNTTPRLECFPNASNQQSWLLRFLDYGLLWDSDSIVGMEWARAGALGASCSQEAGEGGILRYVNTAQVVEDILEIVEREGEWRASEAQRLAKSAAIMDLGTIEQRVYHPGREKLQFWGMSYGTVIGTTFAAMHPDRVGRIVIDGVVDAADHYSGGYLTQLTGSDEIISNFCKYCYEAGPQCPLFLNSSSQDIEDRFTSIIRSLKNNPIPVDQSFSNLLPNIGPEVLTYGDIHLYLLSGMYFSFAMAETLFSLLYSLESLNTTSPFLAGIVASKQAQLSPSESDDIPYISIMGSFQSISCMDSIDILQTLTKNGFNDYLVELKAQGHWIFPSWARSKLVCRGFTVHPVWKPSWTFETQEWDNTSHPLLIVGNSHDTVTPIRNAHRVSTLFPGSVVLEQASEGHCSHSNPSVCTGKIIREYFQSGNLPREGTVCQPEMKPFVGCLKNDCQFADPADKQLLDVMSELADPFGLRKKDGREVLVSTNQLLRIHK